MGFHRAIKPQTSGSLTLGGLISSSRRREDISVHMGKKIDALLGRNSHTRKLESLAQPILARAKFLKNQHRVRCNLARSDVVQLLNLGYKDQALLRVVHVIKEQNMLDALDLIEKYSHLLTKRLSLLKSNSECPEELNEAISSLVFAASRCGEFPELHEVRVIFSLMYGKEFVDCAIELRNNCRVNHKIIKMLSSRPPSLETRKHFLKQIASDNGIILRFEENANATITEEKRGIVNGEKQLQPYAAAKRCQA